MSEASWISPDEGLTATGLTRCLLVIKGIGKPVSTQNHYSSTAPLLALKCPQAETKLERLPCFLQFVAQIQSVPNFKNKGTFEA